MADDLYGMTSMPFARNIPALQIYKNDSITDAIHRLKYACTNKQFAVLIGDTGTGKTAILRHVSELLPATDYLVMYMCEQHLTPRLFYNHILVQLGYAHTMQFANARLAVQREIGLQKKKIVVMIDEGQMLPVEMLNEIRFMLNYKMDSENPFALIISATKDFWGKLRHESFSSTLNRVNLECCISPFSLEQTREYIDCQLKCYGHEGKLFTDAATNKIHKASKGVASVINRICTQAILLASQLKYETVDDIIVDNVIKTEITMTTTT